MSLYDGTRELNLKKSERKKKEEKKEEKKKKKKKKGIRRRSVNGSDFSCWAFLF